MSRIPETIAFIPDANRTWAAARGLDPWVGHEKGIESVRRTAHRAKERGVKTAIYWGAARRNLTDRPEDEVTHLKGIFHDVIDGPLTTELIANEAQIGVIGDLEFDPVLQEKAERVIFESKKKNPEPKIQVVFALNYDGEWDMEQANKQAIDDALRGEPRKDFKEYLSTAGLFDSVDLLIRAGGQQRTSNFLPLQAGDAELHFTNTLWPDFTGDDLDIALDEFSLRKRKFGR